MGKLLKFGMLVLSAFVLIFIIVGVFKGISNLTSQQNVPGQSTAHMPDKKDYDKVRIGDAKTGNGGMTLKEVEKILGQSTSETEGQSGNLTMKVYTFASSSGPNSIMVTFIDGHASGKTQTGLK